jgi:hypothetical protein
VPEGPIIGVRGQAIFFKPFNVICPVQSSRKK